MRAFLKLGFIFIFILSLLLTPRLFAKNVQFQSFVDQESYLLEQSIKQKYSIEELAQYQSQVFDLSKNISLSDDDLKLYVAGVWINQRYLPEALQLLKSIESPDSHEDLIQYYLAMTMLETNQMNQAVPIVNNLLIKYPNDADMMFLKSHVLAQGQNLRGAIETLDINIKLRQKKGKTYLQRGLLYLITFDYDSAVRDLREALRNLDDKEIYYRQMAHFQLGLIYLKYYNKESKAKTQFFLGKKLDPTSRLAQQLDQNLKWIV